ncbi:hypothetical protein [Paenibacillus sp. CMAA1364]
MTKIWGITLRNLLISCCVVMMILIGVKFHYIQEKMAMVTEAERLYALQDLIGAEEWYHKARNNNAIQYKESDIARRLDELAPITEIRTTLSQVDREAMRAKTDGYFEALMKVYTQLEVFKSIHMKEGNPYAPYYVKLSDQYGLSDDFITYFQHFKTLFTQQLERNLDSKAYEDESFKWKLWTLPVAFFGDTTQKKTQLYDIFQTYDLRKMTQIAAAGQYDMLLDESLAMLNLYKTHDIEAAWINDQSDMLARTFLEQDISNRSYAIFATHAKKYNQYIEASTFKSPVASYITKQINHWMKEAKQHVSKNQFEDALTMYEGLMNYMDTSEEIQQAELAWNIHEPIRFLQQHDPTQVFTSITSGTKRFGAIAYVLAVDEQQTLYFARLSKDNSVHVLSNREFQHEGDMEHILIDEDLSTKEFAVSVIQGQSSTRTALFTAIEWQTDSVVTLFQFEADQYIVGANGQLLVDNLNTFEGADHVAIYERSGDRYTFMGIQQDYIEIYAVDLIQYMHEKVKFTTNVIQSGYNEGYATMGDSYVKLTGNYNFRDGPITVIGTFRNYVEIYVEEELTLIPVFEVETME